MQKLMSTLPWCRAVLVEAIKVDVGEQLASVDPRLNCAEATKNSDLLNVANDRGDFQPLQLGIDGMESTDQMLEEQFEGLGQAEHGLAGDHEGCHLLTPVFNNLALVGGGIVGRNGGRGAVPEGAVHELVHEVEIGRPGGATRGPEARGQEGRRMAEHWRHRRHRHGGSRGRDESGRRVAGRMAAQTRGQHGEHGVTRGQTRGQAWGQARPGGTAPGRGNGGRCCARGRRSGGWRRSCCWWGANATSRIVVGIIVHAFVVAVAAVVLVARNR